METYGEKKQKYLTKGHTVLLESEHIILLGSFKKNFFNIIEICKSDHTHRVNNFPREAFEVLKSLEEEIE